MGIDTETRQAVDYFVGIEVEHTIMKDKPTLFVVGIKPVEEILMILNEENKDRDSKINHVYFGTSQSFNPRDGDDWRAWDRMIAPLLKQGIYVTLDFDVAYAQDLHEEGWCEYNNFIPMIRVKIPYIRLYNYHTTIKIDDLTWGKSNPGVWCHPLHELQQREAYTDWSQYVGDTVITYHKDK